MCRITGHSLMASGRVPKTKSIRFTLVPRSTLFQHAPRETPVFLGRVGIFEDGFKFAAHLPDLFFRIACALRLKFFQARAFLAVLQKAGAFETLGHRGQEKSGGILNRSAGKDRRFAAGEMQYFRRGAVAGTAPALAPQNRGGFLVHKTDNLA